MLTTTTHQCVALLNAAADLHQRGKLAEAAESYKKVLSVDKNNGEAMHFLATLEGRRGNYTAAVSLFEKVVQLRPDLAEAICNRGTALQDLNLWESALLCFERAIVIRPSYSTALNNRGAALDRLGRKRESIISFDQAILFQPSFAEAFFNRGLALEKLDRWPEALVDLDRSLLIKQSNAEALNSRGNVLYRLERWAEALSAYNRATLIKPDYVEAFNNRGAALQMLGRAEEAITSFEKAIRIDPDFADAYGNQSQVLLLLGRFSEGWRKYEWRLKKEDLKYKQSLDARTAWRGKESVTGKRLLIQCEQGLGDSIQFVRYLPMIAALGAEIFVSAPKTIASLLSDMQIPMTLIAEDSSPPPFDVCCPLMSLPFVFDTTIETIPAPIPYIRANPNKKAIWKKRLGSTNKTRVGLVWSGSTVHKRDSSRSIKLEALISLLALPIEWHSLQTEYRDYDAEVFVRHPQVQRHDRHLTDFSETAALLDCLDMVITVDTSVAHLAGAMGKPAWVLLPFVPDFRWLLDRSDSPWYPSIKLFRQDKRRDWTIVISEVRDSLNEAIRHRAG